MICLLSHMQDKQYRMFLNWANGPMVDFEARVACDYVVSANSLYICALWIKDIMSIICPATERKLCSLNHCLDQRILPVGAVNSASSMKMINSNCWNSTSRAFLLLLQIIMYSYPFPRIEFARSLLWVNHLTTEQLARPAIFVETAIYGMKTSCTRLLMLIIYPKHY